MAEQQHHAELDELFDCLDLTDSSPQISLKSLLLGSDDESLRKLESVIAGRLEEGHGEALFELGFETNGDSMGLTRGDWDVAYSRLIKCSKRLSADCDLLLTRNVGGEVEATSSMDPKLNKNKDCSGKVLIRKIPATVEDVIEVRIAVVGNGGFLISCSPDRPQSGRESTQAS